MFKLAARLAARLAAVALLALAAPRVSVAATTTRTATRTTTSTTTTVTRGPRKTATKRAPKNGPIVLYHVNRRETMALRLRDAHGRPVKGMQKRFDHFLRCHHTTGQHYPGRRIEVVSGYRHPTVAKNPHSPHMKGLACDFRVEGIKTAELRDYLRKTYEKVGVGYYPNSSFVHLDVRKDRSAFWIDYSGPGERAMYSETPDQDLRSGRADRYHPTKIDNAWTDDGSGTAPAPDKDGEPEGEPDGEPDKAKETP